MIVIIEGIISTLFSLHPESSGLIRKFGKAYNTLRNKTKCTTALYSTQEASDISLTENSKNFQIEKQSKKEQESYKKSIILVAKCWLLLILAISPLIGGLLITGLGQEENIYLNIKPSAKNFSVRGILVSKSQLKYFENNDQQIVGVLTDLAKCSDPRERLKHENFVCRKQEILLASICYLSKQTENDLKRYRNATAIIIHEEDGDERDERPSSPLPYAILKMYADKETPVLVHVRRVHESKQLNSLDGGIYTLIDTLHTS
jgi:hypothetical protein